MKWQRLMVVGFAVLMAGCDDSAVVIGNSVSMLVVCVLLWSTVNLGDSTSKRERDDGMG